MLSFDQISPKLKCGGDEYLCFPCVGTKYIKANGNRVLEVFIQWYSLRGIPSMLCNGNVRKRCFCYVRHPLHLLVLFAIPKSIFIRQDHLNRLKQC